MSVTETDKQEISDTNDVINLINNFDGYIDHMNLCDADRKFIDNHLEITKNVSKEIEKKTKFKFKL